jgi:uncharacterized protein (TIGR02466 family)
MFAWQSPLFFSAYPLHEDAQTDLLAFIESESQQQDYAINSGVAIGAKQHLLESQLDFLEYENAVVAELRQFIEAVVELAASDVNAEYWPEDAAIKVDIVESWYHITRFGGYHDVHSHPNCSWCGIYFLQSGQSNMADGGGINRFYDPRTNAGHYLDAGSQYLDQEAYWDVSPMDGQMVIFPSYLKHSALAYYGKTDRVVIAFNCQVKFLEDII